jgi:uncharacterized membrane protein
MLTEINTPPSAPCLNASEIGWAFLIVILLAVAAMPYFLGLVVTLPVLGHTTWHLYRRIIAPVG